MLGGQQAGCCLRTLVFSSRELFVQTETLLMSALASDCSQTIRTDVEDLGMLTLVQTVPLVEGPTSSCALLGWDIAAYALFGLFLGHSPSCCHLGFCRGDGWMSDTSALECSLASSSLHFTCPFTSCSNDTAYRA